MSKGLEDFLIAFWVVWIVMWLGIWAFAIAGMFLMGLL